MPVERLEGFQTGRAAGESEEEFKRGLHAATSDDARSAPPPTALKPPPASGGPKRLSE